jgi:hypothetical protein
MKWNEFVKQGNKIMKGHENEDIFSIIVFLQNNAKIELVKTDNRTGIRNVHNEKNIK